MARLVVEQKIGSVVPLPGVRRAKYDRDSRRLGRRDGLGLRVTRHVCDVKAARLERGERRHEPVGRRDAARALAGHVWVSGVFADEDIPVYTPCSGHVVVYVCKGGWGYTGIQGCLEGV